jgi:hypothetical protein
MVKITRTLTLLSALVLGAAPLWAQRRPITAVEIEKAAVNVATAFDAVHSLRPRWLQVPREIGSQGQLEEIHVFQGEHDMGGVDYLKTIAVEHVATIRWYSTTEAGSRFGPIVGPVIAVTLKAAGPP